MTELDQVWTEMLVDAAHNASVAGHHHAAEYLRLKATNDAIRAKAAAWLIDTFITAASDAMREHPHLTVERDEPHSFTRENSTMVGTRLTLKNGVRSLTLECGWTRSPGHGIMRGQALAAARITHFGLSNEGQSLRLMFTDDLPKWLIDDTEEPFGSDHAGRHLTVLLN